MLKFLHHLFNPHCEDCRLERECKNCEVLRSLLEAEKFEKKQLLNAILERDKLAVAEMPSEIKPIMPKQVPWAIRRQMLESEDKKAAELLKAKSLEMSESAKSTEQLESELLGEGNASK